MTDVPPFLFRFYRPFCVGVDLSCDMKSSREFDFRGLSIFCVLREGTFSFVLVFYAINKYGIEVCFHIFLSQAIACNSVRVKGPTSLRKGMLHDLRNGVTRRNIISAE